MLSGEARSLLAAALLLTTAVARYLPELEPDFVRCRRVEVFDENGEVFR